MTAAALLLVCLLATFAATLARSYGAEAREGAWVILAGAAGATGVLLFVLGVAWHA